MIKNAVRRAAFKDLELIKETHSKVKENTYFGLKYPQKYLTDRSLTTLERSIIFGLKSRTIRGIKDNFKNKFADNTLCPICERYVDSQEHAICCPVLLAKRPQVPNQQYKHIYGNVKQQKEIAQVFIQYLKLRDELLADGTDQNSSIPGLYAGPVRPQASSQ